MIFKVLGCFGSELPGYRCPGFLVNGRLLLEAGTATSVLTWHEQLEVSDVCVTHVHLDHVKDLAFLVDNRLGHAPRPLVVAGTAEVIDSLRRDLFNGRIWPDFSRIPSRRRPSVVYRVIPEAATRGSPGSRSNRSGSPPGGRHCVHPARARASILYTGDTAPPPPSGGRHAPCGTSRR